ncbi:dynamin family protein [Umezawaea tangerina]|uniref:Dynamin family protein n=1 Tax=Umezawaea tangerina TaxID=84725 RepID=A0A2T0T6T0_9PSEU|nr:dynamin family protein [Umezawaea tangerina]PRY41332.1 dynamin family protein [Umezawaea tangerina]
MGVIGPREYGEHLDWIVAALGQVDLPRGRSEWANAAVARVRARMGDPELHIAVLGETSSGKSTLLNAFLRQRLLPSSALVATRTTLTIRHGPQARLTGGRTCWVEDLASALRHALTTDAADGLHDLELCWPTPLLGDGVTITDTPGFSVDDAGHRERAVAAAESADLVLVVVPAVAAMSRTLAEFLSGPLRDHRDRCAFLLTKIDMVEPHERAEVLEVTARRLRELGVEEPVVFPCVPQAVLRTVDEPDAGMPFADVEAGLVALTARRRQAAIAATLSSLLTELLRTVEQAAVRRGTRLAAAEQELAGLSLPDLRAFLATWAQDAVAAGVDAVSLAWGTAAHRYFASDLVDRMREAVEQGSVTTAAEMAAAAIEAVRECLHSAAHTAVTDVITRIDQALSCSATALSEEFIDQFARLARLADAHTAVPAPPPVAAAAPAAPDLTKVNDALTAVGTRLSNSAALRAGGGAALGAAAGTVMIPIPVVGTVLGALFGSVVGIPGTETQRTRFLAQATPVVAEVRTEVAVIVEAAVKRVLADHADRVDHIRVAYLRAWLSDVDDLAWREARSRERLADFITAATRMAEQARERREQIGRLRAALSGPPAEAVVGRATT